VHFARVKSLKKGDEDMAQMYRTLVIPGFMGSSLSYKGGKTGKTRLWWNPSKIITNTPLAMALAADGKSPYPIVGRTLFPDGPVDMGIYEPLLTQLANDGMSPYFYSYDWRLSPVDLAASLANAIGAIGLTNPFYVVAHSFGGILAQLAYPIFLANNTGLTWATTCYLGTPQGGSYWALAALNGYFGQGSMLYSLALTLRAATGGIPIGESFYSAALATLTALAGTWPALYCLLPNSNTPWLSIDGLAPFFLTTAAYPNAPSPPSAAWLALAGKVLQSLSAGQSTPRPAEIAFVGRDMPTPALLSALDLARNPDGYTVTLDGDGTVPNNRATLPPANYIEFKRTGHNDLPRTAGPLGLLTANLLGPHVGEEVENNTPLPPTFRGSTQPLLLTPTVTYPFLNMHLDP
jgi:hypothetical protein